MHKLIIDMELALRSEVDDLRLECGAQGYMPGVKRANRLQCLLALRSTCPCLLCSQLRGHVQLAALQSVSQRLLLRRGLPKGAARGVLAQGIDS